MTDDDEQKLSEFVKAVQRFQNMNLGSSELKLLWDGFRENYRFLKELDQITLIESDEPNGYVNLLIKKKETRV